MKFQIYIDYDENPDIGGQQAIYYVEGSGHTHDASDLIGAKIVGAEFPDGELDALGHAGRVLVLTLEKVT